MSRLRKLRRNPEQFFRDSRSVLVRVLGGAIARVVLGADRVNDWFDEPRSALAGANVPVVSELARRADAREARQRRQLLASHGQPTVSVIMAAYNASATIQAAIRSLQQQTYANFELVVVDDASTDDTVAIVEALASADRRVRVLTGSPNTGVGGARNRGLQACTGAFIGFQDSDDELHAERLERQLAALVRSPSASVCLCNGRRVAPDGTPVVVNGRLDYKWINSMMFPRRVFDRLGYFMDLRLSEDAEYYERIRLVFGDSTEVRLFKTLYYAGFSPGSLLFSDGATAVDATGSVTHTRSADAEHTLEAIRAQHDRIRRGELDPYVAFDSPTSDG